MQTETDEDVILNVQFFPCGHFSRRRTSTLIKTGYQKQVDDIVSGKKLDAVIMPRTECDDCQEERDRVNRCYAEFDICLMDDGPFYNEEELPGDDRPSEIF